MSAQPTHARRVIKFGGNEIDDPAWLARLVAIIAGLDAAELPVIVHGGGKEIGQLQTALGGEPRFIDGLRYTDATALQAATMVLCGAVSTRLVAALTAGGVDALGMAGVDRGLVRAERQSGRDLGAVGAPVSIRADILLDLLRAGVVPVIAPICADAAGQLLNVNADQLAGALAAALAASEAVFVSNVPGVLVGGAVAPRLAAAEVRALIADGTISGGMIPKVTAALLALDQGVRQVRITNLAALQGGTLFVREV